MQTVSSLDKDYVLVEYGFQYTGKDGRLITINPHERYILLKKTNEHWWHVCRDSRSQPFYIPAKYVKVLSPFSRGSREKNLGSAEEVTEELPPAEYSYRFLPADPPPCTKSDRDCLPGNVPTNSSSIQHRMTASVATNVTSNQEPVPSSVATNGSSIQNQLTASVATNASSVQHQMTASVATNATINQERVPSSVATNASSSQEREPSSVATNTSSSKERIPTSVATKAINNQDCRTESVFTKASSNQEQAPANVATNVSSNQEREPDSVATNNGSTPDHVPASVATNASSTPDRVPVGVATNTRNATDRIKANVQRYSMMPGGCSHSLSDISVIRGHATDDHPFTGPKKAPLRTFHNSKKFLDPLKRVSLLDLPKFQSQMRPSQSLNDLHMLRSELPISDHWQQEGFIPHGIQSNSLRVGHTAGAAGDSPKKAVAEAEEAVYVNLKELREERGRLNSSASTLDEWETHTDQRSGRQFYYNCVTGETTWDCPFYQGEEALRSPFTPPPLSPPPGHSDWEKHFDESSGNFFFYNPLTGETSWDPPPEEQPHPPGQRSMFSPLSPVVKRPPTPEADYPDSPREIEHFPEADYVPPPPSGIQSEDRLPGWSYQLKNDQRFYINDNHGDTWLQSEDQNGKPYYYPPDGSVSQWNLPQPEAPELQRGTGDSDHNSNIISNWRAGYSTFTLEKTTEPHPRGLEKAGVLHKTKIAENGRRLRKNWSSSWTVLEGGILTFFKDAKNLSSNSLRHSLLTTPEHTLRLQGAILGWASKEKSSKKHVIELKTQDGSEYLIHHDSEAITNDWYTSISKSITKDARMSCESTSENESDSLQEFGSTEKLGLKDDKEKKSLGQNSNASDSDRNVRNKLRKFLQRRPTLQSLKDKGYIRDQVFGCPLEHLCDREKRSVPSFVCKCIQAVEKRGLDIDGLYRVSGNLAIIQKLRYKADHDENLNLEDGKWEDVHVITGALKLFFRELPEPLFPYSHFDHFVEAIKLGEPSQKIRRLRELVLSLPTPNLETMKLLFKHLCSVIEQKDSNRMSVQSVAIVFGPTLLRPEEEGANIAMFMVFQNQIVEQILIHYKYLFSS